MQFKPFPPRGRKGFFYGTDFYIRSESAKFEILISDGICSISHATIVLEAF